MPNSPPLRSDEVVVGCVTEDNPKFLGQTLRLLQSIRWFGGSLAQARVVVGAVEKIDRRARRTLEALGADIRIVPRFEQPNASANRLQLFPELRGEPASHILMLDCDTIVVRDPLPLLARGVLHAKIAPFPTVTRAVFERLFAHFGLPLPERAHLTTYSRTPTIPYFNAGMLCLPRELAERLFPEWRRFNAVLAAEPELVAPCARHLHQAALALAVAKTGIPFAEAGVELNYQLNNTQRPPRGYPAVDPAIIHYHDLVDEDGLLLPTPFPRAQERIDRFNQRLGEERSRAMAVRTAPAASSQQVVILGAPRSGTSLAAQRRGAMGAHAGEAHELRPPDVYRPAGTWQRRDVIALHDGLMSALGASWLEPDRADVARLDAAARAEAASSARAIAERASLIHEPRTTLLFPIWREALDRPLCVLVWRDPLANARALARACGLPILICLAVWEEYTRRMLAATVGLPRVLVSYEELTGETEGNGADQEHLLEAPQRELREALRSGAALQWDTVPPTRDEIRALLSAFGGNDAAARRAAELERRLNAVTGSRIWRAGSRIAALLRRPRW